MEKEATCHCAICPLCDLRFPATSLLEANIGLYEHLLLGHPGLQGDDLIGAYIDAARIKAEGERCFPNVLEDRVPETPEPTSLDLYQYCPECGECLEADSLGALRDCFVRHYQIKHPSSYREGLGDKEVRHIWAFTTVLSGPKPAPPPRESATPAPIEPPIGIQSEHQWHEQRMYELIACINRYHESGFPVKPEWLEELGSMVGNVRYPRNQEPA